MNQHCNFCIKFGRHATDMDSAIYDRILFESPNFVVVPTVGALTPGWLLMVPRTHHICFGALGQELLKEFHALRNHVARAIEECYGSAAVFEHGPTDSKQPVGCSVDHAHLHILSTEFDLLREVKHVFPHDLRWNVINGIEDLRTVHNHGLPYLYLEQPIGTCKFASHPRFESQIFRKVIGRCAGTPERFDWRSFPESKTVESTVATIERWILENKQVYALDSAAVAA